jgi:hypothetical protein
MHAECLGMLAYQRLNAYVQMFLVVHKVSNYQCPVVGFLLLLPEQMHPYTRKCHAMNNTWCNHKYYIYDAIDIKDLWCKLECPSRNEVIIVRVDGRGNMRHLLTTVRVGQQPYQHATLADFYTLACWHVQGTNALLS